jgi:hypothetical protein
MSIIRVKILKAPRHGSIDVIVGAVCTVGIGPHRQNGSTSDALLTVSPKTLHAWQLPPERTLARQILGSYFRTSHLHAIPQRIHLGPAHVNGVYEFVMYSFVCHFLIFHVLRQKQRMYNKIR